MKTFCKMVDMGMALMEVKLHEPPEVYLSLMIGKFGMVVKKVSQVTG